MTSSNAYNDSSNFEGSYFCVTRLPCAAVDTDDTDGEHDSKNTKG